MPTRSTYDRVGMTVLTTTKAWRRPPQARPDITPDLTDAERANLRAAVRFLAARLGGAAKLARTLQVSLSTVQRATGSRGRPGAGLAIRVARTAGVPLEDVLGGAWPPAGA